MPTERPKYTRYLIIDFEATCSENNADFPRDEMEIIEFGAVLCDAGSLAPLAEFQSFVKPVRHPRLTAFCQKLTSITQAQVDAAPRLPEVLARLKEQIKIDEELLFCSWGDYDKNQLRRDCSFHRAPYPFRGHLNLKRRFSEQQEIPRELGLGGALREAGLSFEGTQHRAIDDARNIVRLLPYIF
jgi:inhibitor of KinA sporulation pathway (predicted exonuclease)